MPAGRGEAIPAGAVDVTAPAKPAATALAATETTETAAGDSSSPADAAAVESAIEESASSKAKKAADAARKGAANNRKLMEERDRIAQSAQYATQQAQNYRAQLEQNNAFLTNLQRDPLAALKQMGVTPEQVAQRMAAEGSPEAMIADMRKQIEDQNKRYDALIAKEQAALQAARAEKIENEYKRAAQDTKKYPNISQVHPDFVIARTRELLISLREQGHDPSQFSDHDLLSYLDSAYSKTGSAVTPPKDGAAATSEKKTGTITNRMQSASHTAPPDFNKMSDRQQKKWMADQIRAQFATK